MLFYNFDTILCIQNASYKLCPQNVLALEGSNLSYNSSPQPHAELLQRGFLYAIRLGVRHVVGGVALRTLFISLRSKNLNAIYFFFFSYDF